MCLINLEMMKPKTTLLLFICTLALMLCPVLAQAQTQFGLKGGLVYSSLRNGDELERWDVSALTSYTAGGFMEVSISDKVSFGTDLDFARKGFKEDGDSRIIAYLNLYPHIEYYFKDWIHIEAGPQVGLILAQVYVSGDRRVRGRGVFGDTFDYSVNLGSYVRIVKNIEAGLRYNLSINELTSVQNPESGEIISLYHSALVLELKYMLTRKAQ